MPKNNYIPRALLSVLQRSSKSVLLLGPRQVGKSTLMLQMNPDLNINLAREATYLEFARNVTELEERLAVLKKGSVLIDEIQRLPSLLNTIQSILDTQPSRYRFLLTGSSARKLIRGKANLLPGRLHTFYLGPVSCEEQDFHSNLKTLLAYGSLPGILTSTNNEDKTLTLSSYAATYLKEEIQAEALTKNIEGFSRFIYIVAAEAGRYLDLSKLASEAMIPRQSAVRYFEILEDTLVVKRCEAFAKSARKRLIQHPKFYFFDVGVLNGLLNNFSVSADRIGLLFEHFLFNQLNEIATSNQKSVRISSYRTENHVEVDFILEYQHETIAIEVKASKTVSSYDTKGLKNFADYFKKPCRLIIVYLGEEKKIVSDIEVLPWLEFLRDYAA